MIREFGHLGKLVRRSNRDDRGVSEVISFVITFSIITMMVGLLYTAGTVSMNTLQTGNQMHNAEGVFFAMSDSFTELEEGQAPRRAGSLDLDVGASIAVINESRIDVTVNGPGYSATLLTRSTDYRLEDRSITYETGAIFRSNDGNSVMVREPGGIFCSPESNASVVSVVTLVDAGDSGQAAGTVTVTGVQRSTKLLFPTDRNPTAPVENVTIDVTSPHGAAWERFLEESPGWEDEDGDGTFACESAERVFVRRTVIEVEFTG